FMAGLSNGDTSTSYPDIDFAILVTGSGGVYVYESGGYVGSYGTFSAGDRFRVEVVGGVVRYKRNDVLFYTSTRTPTYPLNVDTSLQSANSGPTSTTIAATGGGVVSQLPPQAKAGLA